MSFFTRKLNGKLNKNLNSNPMHNTATLLPVNTFVLARKNAWFLWLCQCLNITTIALELGTWMLAIITLSLTWQAFLLHRSFERPNSKKQAERRTKHAKNKQNGPVSPFVLATFAIAGCLTIVITAPQHGLLISMVHLLCFSYVLKAFELKARSDFYQLILLGIFVLASALIFKQDLAFSALVACLLLLNFVVLLQHFSTNNVFIANFKIIGILMTQSVLLAVVLFIVFPRLSPFWQVPIAKSAETGLSDTVKPGDIAKLTRSSKLAFRVSFEQQSPPAYSQLYWRAMVLEDYDGKQWTKRFKRDNNKPSQLYIEANKAGVKPITYQVLAEPSFQKYLFALAPANLSEAFNGSIIPQSDYTFLSSSVISQTKAYHLTSYLGAPIGVTLDDDSKALNLAYPKNSNPRLEQLALQLSHNYSEPLQRAQAVLNLINEENYAYTLEPPLLKNNSLDQFFFDTQSGFCVHYASAFTFLMRASGIPARMVTGYLGGEYNDKSANPDNEAQGHLSIYQYDAHAWSEIWIQGKGWLRIDPTSAVDPERVNSGWSDDLLQQQSALINELFSRSLFKNSDFLNALRLQFDALDYQWTKWVVGFSTKQQYDLLTAWFGNMKSWKVALIIVITLIISMTALVFIFNWLNRADKKQHRQNLADKIYAKALLKLAGLGIDKPPAMTVNDFAKQIREKQPMLAISFTRLSNSYNNLCYQNVSEEDKALLTITMQQQYQQFVKNIKSHK